MTDTCEGCEHLREDEQGYGYYCEATGLECGERVDGTPVPNEECPLVGDG